MIANIEQTPAGATLAGIEALTKPYADARRELADAVEALNDIIEAAKRQAMPKLKRLVAMAAERELTLKNAVQAAPELFARPRTVVFHGVTVGLRKGSGGVDWDDDDRVVKLIEKHFSKDEAELLIKTTKKPIAKALADLDVAELKKIGCTVEGTGDVVVVKPADSAVNKIVNALLKDAAEVQS
jgi:hypothetical protein